MNIKTTPDEVFKEFHEADSYNEGIDLYEQVKKNERFFIGDQWHGLNAPHIRKLKLNFLKRVITYFISMINSDDIGTQIKPFFEDANSRISTEILTDSIDRVIERAKIKAKNREALKNCAVDGDTCMYFYFDDDIEIGQLVKGDITAEVIDNTNVLFANPYSADVQSQPYILIIRRRNINSVKEWAKNNGCKDWESIVPDGDSDKYCNEDKTTQSSKLCTEIIKFWKVKTPERYENDTYIPAKTSVHYIRTTKNVVLKEATDLKYSLYPIAYMNWERIKNSYHGQAAITEMIDNQIEVNRLWSMVYAHCQNIAFPKIIYDKSKISKWDSTPGSAIETVGNPNDIIVSRTPTIDLSSQVLAVVEKTISMTRDFMGASDVALGNITNPDNTSAIMAVQTASQAPLELQRRAFYQFVEDYIRIIVDIICTDYGTRLVTYTDIETDEKVPVQFDFGSINYNAMEINVEVGAASYWSEQMQLRTMDNLYLNHVFTDAETYVNSIPNAFIKNKADILRAIKASKAVMPENTTPNQLTQDIPVG